MIDERGSGLAHEYYDIMLYDVTWLVKQNVCLICCTCDEH